ncbi:glycosyltransferase [Verrucomicrobium spinosum]|uniref:glycosyltransferase n=2 Tax=Verrucomicrobium spinosum TaxID=2736 RepID=UPI0001745550|nr:glycosyltransferase [Verrucomicrobium spinosum]
MSEPTVAIVTKARGTFFKPLYEAFAQAQPEGWRTMLLWPAEHGSEHPEELVTPRADNLDIVPLHSTSHDLKANDAALEGRATRYQTQLPAREMWARLAERDVRGILIHEFSPFTLQALLYARWHRIPVCVSTEVGRGNAPFFGRRTRWWHALWGRLVDGVVACCPAAHHPLSRKQLPTVSTYHAVDSRLYVPVDHAPSQVVTFAYLGQLIRRKGLDLLLQAAARMKENGENRFRIRLIGGGDAGWLHELAHALGLWEQVEFTGFLSGAAIREALASADVFVLPTRQDTYAAVVHEAACLGLPLLISKHAGAAEALVKPGRNGYIFEPEDTASFAAKMQSLMPARVREPMRKISREVGEAHSAHARGAALWEWMVDHALVTTRHGEVTLERHVTQEAGL